MAEMQQHWGKVMQTFLGPNLQAAWLYTAWVPMTQTETCGKEQNEMSPEVHAPILTSLISWSLQVSALISLPLPKRFPNTSLRERLCNVRWSPWVKGFSPHIILLLICHIPWSSPPTVWLPQFSCTITLSANLLGEQYQKSWSLLNNFFEYDIWSSVIPLEMPQCTNCYTVKKTWAFLTGFWRYEEMWPPMTKHKHILKYMNKMLTLSTKWSAEWGSN